jgi:hypothetical protein
MNGHWNVIKWWYSTCFCSNDFKLSKGNKFNYVHYEKKFKNNLESFHLNKISIRYEFSKFMFL